MKYEVNFQESIVFHVLYMARALDAYRANDADAMGKAFEDVLMDTATLAAYATGEIDGFSAGSQPEAWRNAALWLEDCAGMLRTVADDWGV